MPSSAPGQKDALKDISLSIPSGRTIAFVGPSGGGKTTLANVIARFFDPQEGTVKIGGADVREIPKKELMNTVSFVFQNSRLIKARPGKCADGKARRFPGRGDQGPGKCPVRGYHRQAAQGSGYSDRDEGRVSLGRRTAAHRYCTGDAENDSLALILDEATAFADPDNESRVQAAFSRLSQGKTVIMIAHRLSTIAHVDQIYVLKDGEIVENGTSGELLAQEGEFRKMWKNYQTSVQWKVEKEA